MSTLSLEDFKNIALDGYLCFTDAEETGGWDTGPVADLSKSKPGIDAVLMKMGFQFIPEASAPKRKMFMAQRNANESVRYSKIGTDGISQAIAGSALKNGAKTRIDFFSRGHTTTMGYDIIGELLSQGYKVIASPPGEICINDRFVIEPGQNGAHTITQISV